MNRFLLQLMLSKGIGNAAIKKMLYNIRLHADVSFKDYCCNRELLQSVLFRPAMIEETLESIVLNENVAEKMLAALEEQSVRLITENDSEYPRGIKSRLGKDCPPFLFAKGNMTLLESDSVGFCGSRHVSDKGVTITEQCARQLVDHDITVVSGYAGGTDIAAHRATLEAGGKTIFVLAEGILEHKIKREVKAYLNDENHLFVSQFLPESLWSASNAMRRNSVIIGLSKAMILVESGKTGGTFAAGEESLKRKLPLFVVDYAKPEVSAEANPFFIEHGGRPIRSRAGLPNLTDVINTPDMRTVGAGVEQMSMFSET